MNALEQDAKQIDVMQALFGQESFAFRRSDPDAEPRFIRVPNGVWLGKRGPINTRVSAVLVVGTLLPWTAAVRRPEVYFNPWAAYPLLDELAWFDRHIPVGDEMAARPGRSTAELVRLPAGWPKELLSA